MTLVELNETLAVQKIKVAEQTKNCSQLLASIGESTDIAMQKKELSEQKREQIEDQKKIITKEQTEAKQVLAEAQPALDAAKLALGELEKADITEIRFSTSNQLLFHLNSPVTDFIFIYNIYAHLFRILFIEIFSSSGYKFIK